MRGARALLPSGRGGYVLSAALASWLSVVLASAACSLELAASGTVPLRVVLPAMVGTHAIIGIGEALIAVAVLSAVVAARPDVVPEWAGLDRGAGAGAVRRSVWGLAAGGVFIAVALALFGSPFASESPDGLEKIASQKGFEETASEEKAVWGRSLFPDYKVGGLKSEKFSTGLAGLIGTAVVFAVGFGLIRLFSPGAGGRAAAGGCPGRT
jgi:cobalt/nickel transport system permease protein